MDSGKIDTSDPVCMTFNSQWFLFWNIFIANIYQSWYHSVYVHKHMASPPENIQSQLPWHIDVLCWKFKIIYLRRFGTRNNWVAMTLQWQEGTNIIDPARHRSSGDMPHLNQLIDTMEYHLWPTSDSVGGVTAIIRYWLIPSHKMVIGLGLKMSSAYLVGYILSYCWRYGGEPRPHVVCVFKDIICYGWLAPVWYDVCKVGLDEMICRLVTSDIVLCLSNGCVK